MISNCHVALIVLLMTVVGVGIGFFTMFLIVKDNLHQEVTNTLTSFLSMLEKFGKNATDAVINNL